VIYQAVGVVHPVFLGREVKPGTIMIVLVFIGCKRSAHQDTLKKAKKRYFSSPDSEDRGCMASGAGGL